MKPTKTQLKYMREFDAMADEAGCLPVGEWVSGSGQRTKPRALPIGAVRFERSAAAFPRESAYYFETRPRRRVVLWIGRVPLRQAGLI